MTNKRYTDEEILKALECCLCDNSECLQCQNKELCEIERDELAVKTLDLITRKILEIERLKAEIERLQKEANLVSIQFQDLQERTDEIKSKAYKEFADKLEEKSETYIEDIFGERISHKLISKEDIENILTEMVDELE